VQQVNQPLPRTPQRSDGGGLPEGVRQGAHDLAAPFVSRFVTTWLARTPEQRHRSVEATLVFADISGFTALAERLARRGTVGAEQLSDAVDHTFGALLSVAREDGADLLKWGGDAVVLLLDGDGHAVRAARAAHRMRAALRDLVRRRALPVAVELRMSIGVHSGAFDMFLVGDPASHRELIVTGEAATRLVEVEAVARAGDVVVSGATASLLPAHCVGDAVLLPPSAVGAARTASSRAHLLRSRPALVAPPSEEAPAPVDVMTALPPRIRELLGEEDADSEHRPVAVAFVEFTGTANLLRQEGPEAATSAVDKVVRTAQRASLTHGVTFLESDIARDGARILLVAGAPRSTGDDAERLLRTARDIVDAPAVLTVRVGAHLGPVFAGGFGPDFRRTYSVKGDAVNLAARLTARAGAGDVLATDALVTRSRSRVRTERLPPFLVKGKRRPVEAVRVLGLVEGAATVRRAAPLVGRAGELARLREAVDRARSRTGSVVDVSGPPGIGKSRLVVELDPLPDDLVVLRAVCSDYDSSTSYFPFRTLLRDLFGIRPDDDGARVLDRLARRVRTASPRLVPWLPVLSTVLAVQLPQTDETRDLDPRFRRRRLEEVVVELLRATLPTPTLVVLEDAHLLDEASASLLARLLAETASLPWCVVVTRHDDGRTAEVVRVLSEAAAADVHVVTLPLEPLTGEAAADLVESLTGEAHLGVRAIEALADRAAGNPLFLTTLAEVARHEGVTDALPSSVEAVYVRELDRLASSLRTLLRYAAVLGVRFDPHLLAALVDDVDVTAALGRLRDFVELLDDGSVQFRHNLLRDVAYGGLSFRLRRHMHARVALQLEKDGGAGADPAVLSRHFHAAGLHERTWSTSLDAGEQAAAAYAFRDAADHFARALEAAGQLADVDDATRATAYVRLGETRDMAGQSAAAVEAYRSARRLRPGDPVARARLMYREARIDLRRGRHPQALRMLTRALNTVGDLPGAEADAVRAELATRYGFLRHLQGRPVEALAWSRRGAHWAEASGDEAVLAHAWNALHLAFGGSPETEDRPYGRLALTAYERLGDLGGQALCENNLAIDDWNAGRWDRAATMFERAASTFRRVGDEANEGNVTYNLADTLVSRGRFDEALPVLRRALRLARGVDDEELVALALREGARAHAATGDTERAWSLFDDARRRLVDLHLPIEVALLDATHAEALVASGAAQDGIRVVSAATRRAEREHLGEALPRLHRVRAFALLSEGRAAEALVASASGTAALRDGDDGYDRALLGLARATALEALAGPGPLDEVTAAEVADLRLAAFDALQRLGVVRVVGMPDAQMPPRTSRRKSTMR